VGQPYGTYPPNATPPSPYHAYGTPAPTAPGQPIGGADADDLEPDGTGLIVGGVITLGSFYLASVLTGAGLGAACDVETPEELEGTDVEITICGEANTDLVYVPVAGPFIGVAELADTEISIWPLNVAMVGVGLGQITGLGLLLAGAFMGNEDPEPTPSITVTPTVGPQAAAVSIRASF
jgi:hypothetical protein